MKILPPLPARRRENQWASYLHDSSTSPSETTTVLVVENDAMVRTVVQESLQSYGYNVLVARDGFEALTLLCEHLGPIQLLLTDLALPGITGPQVVKCAFGVRPNLRALFISGYPEHMTRQSRGHCPLVPYLQKPFAPAELAHKIRGVLSGPGSPLSFVPDRTSGPSGQLFREERGNVLNGCEAKGEVAWPKSLWSTTK